MYKKVIDWKTPERRLKKEGMLTLKLKKYSKHAVRK